MPTSSFILPALVSAACIAAASAQSPPSPPPTAPPSTLNDIAESQRAMLRQRAMHFYRMPDGTIWDGWNYKEWREVLDRNLKAFDRMERGVGEPGQALVEDKRVGTVWKFKLTNDVRAWGFVSEGGLADEKGELRQDAFEKAHPESWREGPPLWSSSTVAEYTWPFAFIDEQDVDPYTRGTHKTYLDITRDLGQGRFEFSGYSLDRGPVSGLVYVADPAKFIKRDHFKGRFFLWDMGAAEGGGNSWKLLPADEVRMTPDSLADALLTGKAEIVDWTFERVKEKTIWKRRVREIELARQPQPIVEKPSTKPPPSLPGGGPDLVVLKDGRWFRGRIIKKDESSIIIRTFIGQSEMDMTFTMEEVKEFQAPEKRP